MKLAERIKNNIPNSVTCVNLISGVVAIILASKGDEILNGLPAYMWAYIFIGVGAVADFFDGFMARMLNAYSNLGKELDSLCDLVTFGVAPAIILYNAVLANGGSEWVAWASLYIPVCGAIRLAKFNLDERQTTTFIGLPIPANALFWIGFTATCYGMQSASAWVVVPTIIIVSDLMLSSFRMYSLKFKNWSFRDNAMRYILVAAAVMFVATCGLSGFMWLIVYYIISSVGLNRRMKVE